MNYIGQYSDIFSCDECLEIIELRKKYVLDYSDFVFWRNTDGKADVEEFCSQLEVKMQTLIKEYFSSFEGLLTAQDVFLSGIGIIKQPPGAYDALHFDTQVIVNNNKVKQRPFVCLLYLNDQEFQGGQLCFPVQKTVIAPEAGKVVIFPASYHFPHQVMGISGGDRYFLRMNFMFHDSLLDQDIDHWDIEKDGVMKF